MDLRQPRYFLAIAEHRHFGRAAEILHIAQPPLSQQLKALEADLGVQLVDRTVRPIELTHAGEVLFREARELITQFERAESLTRQASAGPLARLAIGVTGTAALEFAAPVLRAFCQRHPTVQLSLRELSSPAQLVAIEAGELQIGFVRPPVLDSRFTIRLVDKDPFVLALPDNHPQSEKDHIRLSELRGTPLVIFEREEAPGFRDLMLHVCRSAGYQPSYIQDAPQMSTMLCLVAAGAGVALVPRSAMRMNIPGVCFRELLDECPFTELYAVWLHENSSIYIDALLDAIQLADKNAP